jgi:hypothetical protein
MRTSVNIAFFLGIVSLIANQGCSDSSESEGTGGASGSGKTSAAAKGGTANTGGTSQTADSGAAVAHPDDAVAYGGHFYRFTDASIGGADAQAECASSGGYLVCIESAEENAFVLTVAGSVRPWIGLNDEKEVANYVWVNGSPVTYKNWEPYQPDKANIERWVKLNADGTWDDAVNPAGYICEWDK